MEHRKGTMSGRRGRKRTAVAGRGRGGGSHAKRRAADAERSEVPGTSSADIGEDSNDCSDWEPHVPAPPRFLDDVRRFYAEIRTQYNTFITTDGLEFYQSMLVDGPKKKLEVIGGYVAELTFDTATPQPTSFVLRNFANSVIDRCSVRCIENEVATPPMQYWTLTECNISCDDELSLSHIPFMGDRDEDDGFVDELLNTFEEGIHGTKVGCGELINDYMLYRLMKRMFAKYPRDEDKNSVYQAIFEQFPNKAPSRELGGLYRDFLTIYENEPMDAKDSDMTANLGDGRAVSSFQLLLCRRCFTYDCLLHGNAREEWSPRRSRCVPSAETCGAECYRLFLKETEELRRGAASPSSHHHDSGLSVRTDDEAWSAHQKALFAVYRTIFKNDYCKIARALMVVCVDNTPPKTCREVYAYSFLSGPISPRPDSAPNSPKKKKKNKKDQHRAFRAVKWAKTEGKVANVHVYEPCNHPGPCTVENGCPCVTVENLCTKFCRCGDQCNYLFPGCRCAPGMCRTKQCQCFYASWECDPDVCKSCKCDMMDDPNVVICKNVSMQRGLQKSLYVAPSQVSGWGCFAATDIEKNDFISEYCGEVITHDESERRGKIYDKIRQSYLFALNEEMVVDATRKGNIIRFANHSKHPNCYGKVFMVNGDHRIGIFARANITANEELFFDYSYNSHQQVKFVSKERPRLA